MSKRSFRRGLLSTPESTERSMILRTADWLRRITLAFEEVCRLRPAGCVEGFEAGRPHCGHYRLVSTPID